MGLQTSEEEDKMKDVLFRQLVGGLQFLAQSTRPDIAYAVNSVSTFSGNPGEPHWTAAKRILRYLKGTLNTKLVYQKKPDSLFEGYSDADWGNDADTRQSVTGYVFQCAGRRIDIMELQETSEFMALSAATQEASSMVVRSAKITIRFPRCNSYVLR
ncbi:uncharacterized protein LOC134288990 [Aedes albopictus]|uniref:Reverse transcriptase Ty1/copia-type domain-containing protein n=1 Tax=Aedes albopictus TaxID=7160 RepID=A0ABM1ZRU8_AEDAL